MMTDQITDQNARARPETQQQPPPALTVRLARDGRDLRAAQRLRYRVFVEELGADGPLVDHAARLERDALDPVFDHLLLIDTRRDPDRGDHVIGAYRLLPDAKRAAAGQFYGEAEFDLAPLRRSGRRLLELGRSCIDPAHRGGLGMLQMWQGLADYAQARGIEILFGAASFPGTDPDRWAQGLSYLHCAHLAPPALRVRAIQANGFTPLPCADLDRRRALAEVPPLIRGYLRLGAVIGEGVFVDQAFRTVDVCIILDRAALSAQARSFAQRGAALPAVP